MIQAGNGGRSLCPVFNIIIRKRIIPLYIFNRIISFINLTLFLEGSDAPIRKPHRSLQVERRDSLIDPQDSNTLEENAPRGKILSGDSNSLHNRDRSPPKSEAYSSLSMEAKLARAESVLRAIMAEGCPSNEGMTVETALKYVDLTVGCRQTAYQVSVPLDSSCQQKKIKSSKRKIRKEGPVLTNAFSMMSFRPKTLSVHTTGQYRFRSSHKNV